MTFQVQHDELKTQHICLPGNRLYELKNKKTETALFFCRLGLKVICSFWGYYSRCLLERPSLRIIIIYRSFADNSYLLLTIQKHVYSDDP